MQWTGLVRPLRTVTAAVMLLGSLALLPTASAQAQSTDAPATTTPVTPPAAPVAPAVPAAPAPAVPALAAPSASAPATPTPDAAAKPANPDNAGASPGDSSISQTLDVESHPAVIISGSATWDDGFKTLTGVFAKLNDTIAKNNLAATGHPLAVFTSTDDAGFKYSAMIPIATAPAGKTELTADIKFGETPNGKAIRFQHRASYDDIDSTYEAITAYLDEKGLEAKNMFAEEYLNLTKTPDDPALQVDIYVFLK